MLVFLTLVGLGAAIAISLKLPNWYRSETVIMLEPQRIPDEYVKSIAPTRDSAIAPTRDRDLAPTKILQSNGTSCLYVLPVISVAVILTARIRATPRRNLAPPAPEN